MDITQLRPTDLDLARTKPALIAVSPVVSIQTALNVMHTNHITSLPIFSHNSTRVVSIINLFDILVYLVGDKPLQGNAIQKDKLRLHDSIESVLGLDSDRESYRMYKTDVHDRLLETMRAFASGVHHSLVIDDEDDSKSPWLLSQTDILRHVTAHPDSICDLDVHATLSSLGLGDSTLITATVDQQALSILQLLARHNVRGVPIVDGQGCFVGDICVEDLPGANLDTLDTLLLPCAEYMKQHEHHVPAKVTSASTLLEAMKLMIQRDTHRVWVVQDKQVTGVVTMSDVIDRLCRKRRPSLF